MKHHNHVLGGSPKSKRVYCITKVIYLVEGCLWYNLTNPSATANVVAADQNRFFCPCIYYYCDRFQFITQYHYTHEVQYPLKPLIYFPLL